MKSSDFGTVALVQDDSPSMTEGEIVTALRRGRSDGADCLQTS